VGSKQKVLLFRKTVYSYYKKQGRHELPWRQTIDPYNIVVSELMLQQTQVVRVIEKYNAFLDAFPSVFDLAKAPLSEVLRLWSGLGYNRRAKYLHALAKEVVNNYGGVFPSQYEELLKLPGIGSYTANAVSVFAYNKPALCIETNIRTVYIHHFFNDADEVSDKELLPIIKETIDTKKPRQWFWALMDYGSYLKTTGNKVHRKSVSYKKQSTFKGSRRQIRGEILKILLTSPASLEVLQSKVSIPEMTIPVLEDLKKEGFVVKKGKKYSTH
jgi:A/G-specific adenine glycosylase